MVGFNLTFTLLCVRHAIHLTILGQVEGKELNLVRLAHDPSYFSASKLLDFIRYQCYDRVLAFESYGTNYGQHSLALAPMKVSSGRQGGPDEANHLEVEALSKFTLLQFSVCRSHLLFRHPLFSPLPSHTLLDEI
jgi:hypothetical protein